MVNMKDQAQSLDGRISNISPFTQFGKDNMIHGPQWVAEQPADHYAIHVATVSSKQELYDVATRFSHYLTDELAYVPVRKADGQQLYAMVYGSYKTHVEARSVLNNLPYNINWHSPSIQKMATVQRDALAR